MIIAIFHAHCSRALFMLLGNRCLCHPACETVDCFVHCVHNRYFPRVVPERGYCPCNDGNDDDEERGVFVHQSDTEVKL